MIRAADKLFIDTQRQTNNLFPKLGTYLDFSMNTQKCICLNSEESYLIKHLVGILSLVPLEILNRQQLLRADAQENHTAF